MPRKLFLCAALLIRPTFAQPPANVQQLPPPARQREMWNDIFENNKMKFRAEASAFVKRAVKGRPPGRALDLGMGTGRNALFLAAEGWTVTGVDISDVAVAKAVQSAKTAGLTLKTVTAGLDEFEPGDGEWDLVVLSFMQFWIANADQAKLDRITKALAPGGILLVEGFAAEDAPGGPKMGFQPNALLRYFGTSVRVIEYQDAREQSDWKLGTQNRVMRIVVER